MGGVVVELNPESLAEMAADFDANDEHKLKIGHKEIDTDSPDWGDVVSLEYLAARDRLIAGIQPSEALVEKNRREGFRRVSMELDRLTTKRFRFRHLSFLGAKRPAIDGLQTVQLATGDEISVSLTSEELADLARRGDVTAARPDLQFAASETHERVRAFMLAHPNIRYVQALEAIGQQDSVRLQFAGANRDSVDLHLAAEKQIEKAKERGVELSYIEGVRRALAVGC